MPKLSYNAEWSEDNEVMIEEKLGLTTEQSKTLFEEHKKIVITKEQAELLASLENDDDEASEASEASEAGDTGDNGGGGDDDRSPDTEHPDADVIDISVAAERDRDAIDVGKALSADTLTAIREGYEAREKVNITTLLVMTAWRADCKKKNLNMGDFPIPNSYRKGGVTVIGKGDDATPVVAGDNARNAPWDKYTYQDVNTDTGKQVTKKASYYGKMFEASPLGIELKKQEDSINAALNSAAFKKDGGPMPTDWKGKTKPQLVRRKRLQVSRFNFGVLKLRAAVTLDKQCRAFDELKQVDYSFETEKVDGVEQYVNRNEPIQVFAVIFKDDEKAKYPNGRPGEPSNLSIGAFCRYNVAEAIAKAGGADKVTLEHLQATVKRDTEKNKNKNKQTTPQTLTIAKPADVDLVYSAINLHFNAEDSSTNTKHMAAYLAFIVKPENSEALLNAGDGIVAQEEIWKHIERPYYDAVAKRTAAKLAEKNLQTIKNVATKTKAA